MFSDEVVLRIARRLHERYLELNGKTVGPSAVAWDALSDETRDSNLSHAAHIETKLHAIGAEVVPRDAADEQFAFTGAEVEQLAIMEHERWMANRLEHGYERGANRTDSTHPDLVAWERLSAEARKKDIDFVVYIPKLLADCGFGIRRTEGAPPAR
ncbi:MAG: RyR domain-containing protein [Actinomycetota bacterium]